MQKKLSFLCLFIIVFSIFLSTALFSQGQTRVNLGIAGNYTIFVFEDINQQNTDCRGAVAAGGNIMLRNFDIANDLSTDTLDNTLVAGGSIDYVQGEVHNGNVTYGDTINLTRVVIHNGTIIQNTPINFIEIESYLKGLSARLAALPVNGTTISQWGNIRFEGTDPVLNVFTLNADDLTGTYSMDMNVPADAKAIINIVGNTNATVQYMGIGSGIDNNKQNTLFNFTNQTSLVMQGIGFKGTILAPYADVDFNNGHVDGSILANSLKGYGETHYFPFNSDEQDDFIATKGSCITLTGQGFGNTSGDIFIGDIQNADWGLLSWADSEIRFRIVVPVNQGTFEIKVVTDNGTEIIMPELLTIVGPILDLSPDVTLNRGESLEINGMYLGANPLSRFIFVIITPDFPFGIAVNVPWTFDCITGESTTILTIPEDIEPGQYIMYAQNRVAREDKTYNLTVLE